MTKKWIKEPKPGQFRGEGEWIEFKDDSPQGIDYWEHLRSTGYLPTHIGDNPPDKNKE